MLARLLKSINNSTPTQGKVKFWIVVVDNYSQGTAEAIVDSYNCKRFPAICVREPKPGIPFARNRVISEAINLDSDAIIFIDDDEIVSSTWLGCLTSYYLERASYLDVVQGPVYPLFKTPLKKWMPNEFFGKIRDFKTGKRLNIASTNNVIFSVSLCKSENFFFNEKMAFCGGTDTDFFRRVDKAGFIIEWCGEAIVQEEIPKSRLTLFWVMKRYYRFGASKTLSFLLNEGLAYAWKMQSEKSIMNFAKGTKQIFSFSRKSFVYMLRYYCEGAGMICGFAGLRLQYNEYKERHK